MFYQEFDPPSQLSTHVSRYWSVAVPDHTEPGFPHRVFPDGCMNLVAMRRASFTHCTVQGPRDTPLIVAVEPGDRYWGVRFWPDAGGAVCGIPAGDLVERMRPAHEVFGSDAAALAERLAGAHDPHEAGPILDEWIGLRVAAAPALDPAVRVAVVAIIAANGGPPVTALARMVGLSPRQLQRRFKRATGLSPKAFARIRRMRAALTHLLDDVPMTWSAVAAELGFADHAHLVREFTRLAGLTPRETSALVQTIHHVDVRP